MQYNHVIIKHRCHEKPSFFSDHIFLTERTKFQFKYEPVLPETTWLRAYTSMANMGVFLSREVLIKI